MEPTPLGPADRRRRSSDLTAEAATGVLSDLLDGGMDLHPRIYVQVQKKLRELGE